MLCLFAISVEAQPCSAAYRLYADDSTEISGTCVVELDTVTDSVAFRVMSNTFDVKMKYAVLKSDTSGLRTTYRLEKAKLVKELVYSEPDSVFIQERDSSGLWKISDYICIEPEYMYTAYKMTIYMKGTPYERVVFLFRRS